MVPLSVDNATLPVPLAITVSLPVAVTTIVRVAVAAASARACTDAKTDRTRMSETKRTERLTGWTWRRPARNRWPPKTKGLASEGVGAGTGVGHDDVAVTVAFPVARVTVSDVAFSIEFAFAVKGEIPLSLASITVAITTERSEAKGFWGASSLELVEFCTEDADLVLVLLANLAVLCLEVVEGLADDVEFVDLTCDLGEKGDEKGEGDERRRIKTHSCPHTRLAGCGGGHTAPGGW